MKRFQGIIYACISSITFGMIPLFTLPVIASGMPTHSIAFYRMLFSVLLLGLLLLITRTSIRLRKQELLKIFLLSFLYAATALLFIESYLYIPSGIATTIHFLYPVSVTLLMFFLFRQKLSTRKIIATALSVLGVCLLSYSGQAEGVSLLGVGIVLITVLTYSSYMVGVNKAGLDSINSLVMTFYVLLFTAILFAINSLIRGNIYPIESTENLINLILLGLIPTILSNLTLILAIKRIGSQTTSILGCLEPLTAIIIGVLLFNENIVFIQYIGVIIVLLAVVLIVLKKRKI